MGDVHDDQRTGGVTEIQPISGSTTHPDEPDEVAEAALDELGMSERVEMPERWKAFEHLLGSCDDDLAYLDYVLPSGQGNESDSEHESKTGKSSKSSKSSREEKGNKVVKMDLVEIADDAGVEVWCAEDQTPYATIRVSGHSEHHAIDSTEFHDYLARIARTATSTTPSEQALKRATQILRGRASYEGSVHQTYVRVAGAQEVIYIDRGDDSWEAIAVGPDGIRLVSDPPVRFRRRKGMRTLPRPAKGSIEQLRRFINVSDDDFPLIVGAILSAFHPYGPYLALILQGPQGCSKTTIARCVMRLTDPNIPELRSEPKSEHDLMVSALRTRVLGFDNLSEIKPWLSDALCRLATGGGFATRRLYSDTDETIIDVRRSIVATGIGDLGGGRPDLRERAIVIEPLLIREEDRKTEEAFWADFDRASPAILGALLEGVRAALMGAGTVKLDALPRMADAAKWISAAEPALGWEPGTFLRAFNRNQALAIDTALEYQPVGSAVRALLNKTPEWEGTATELLSRLSGLVTRDVQRSSNWPKSPAALSNQLMRAEAGLRSVGIEVERNRASNVSRQRRIHLRRVEANSVQAVHAVHRPAKSWVDGSDDRTRPYRTAAEIRQRERPAVIKKAPSLLDRISRLGRGLLAKKGKWELR